MCIAYTDRVNLSVALSDIASGLSLSASDQGLVLSAFFVSYAIFQIPAGWIVDRYGVRWPYVLAFVLWSLSSAGIPLAGTLASLYALRLLLGLGEAVVMPASMRYIRMHFDEQRRGLAVGIFMSGTKIGPAIGFPVAAYLAAAFGWRWMFVLTGLLPLLWLGFYWSWVPKDDAAAQTYRSRGLTQNSEQVSIHAMLASPMMWGTVIGTFCYMYFFYYCMTWMPIYFQQRFGFSVTESGWYTGVSFAGMAVMAVAGGKAADWFIARDFDAVAVRRAFTLAGLGLAATQTAGILTESRTLILFFSGFGLCGLGLATANYWALTQTLVPGAAAGTAVGIQNTAGSVAGIVAPLVTGWMIAQTGSFHAPVRAIGIWLIVGMASYILLVRKRYAPKRPANSERIVLPTDGAIARAGPRENVAEPPILP